MLKNTKRQVKSYLFPVRIHVSFLLSEDFRINGGLLPNFFNNFSYQWIAKKRKNSKNTISIHDTIYFCLPCKFKIEY